MNKFNKLMIAAVVVLANLSFISSALAIQRPQNCIDQGWTPGLDYDKYPNDSMQMGPCAWSQGLWPDTAELQLHVKKFPKNSDGKSVDSVNVKISCQSTDGKIIDMRGQKNFEGNDSLGGEGVWTYRPVSTHGNVLMNVTDTEAPVVNCTFSFSE